MQKWATQACPTDRRSGVERKRGCHNQRWWSLLLPPLPFTPQTQDRIRAHRLKAQKQDFPGDGTGTAMPMSRSWQEGREACLPRTSGEDMGCARGSSSW